MSEYIEIQSEPTEDTDLMIMRTNLPLIEGSVEEYNSTFEMEVGSAVAQTLASIDGLAYLQLSQHDILIGRDPSIPWHAITADISAALKDFFL